MLANSNIEISDAGYRIRPKEQNLEQSFDRERFHDGGFDSSSITADASPTIDNSPSYNFANSNFSSTDVSKAIIVTVFIFM